MKEQKIIFGKLKLSMISFFTNLVLCQNSISHLAAIVKIQNITLKSVKFISAPYARNPIFLFNPQHLQTSFSIHSTNFFNISHYAITGYISRLNITKSKFRQVLRPICLHGKDFSKLTPNNVRTVMDKTSGPLHLRDVVFDVCGGPIGDQFHLTGGSLFTEDISVQLSGVEFRKSRAKKGGAFYAYNGNIFLSDVSFFQCQSSKDSGALFLADCNLDISHSYFVRNHAGQKYGAGYISNGHVNFFSVYVYENNATQAYAGITVENCLGHFLTCNFIDNHSPYQEGGIALNIPSTYDDMIIEYCHFGGFSKRYLRFAIECQLHIFENCFDLSESSAMLLIGEDNPDKPQKFKWYSNKFFGQCSPLEKLPARFYQEIFQQWLDAQNIEWWKLYSGLGMFLIMISLMTFSVPAIFFPLLPGGTRRGTSVNRL